MTSFLTGLLVEIIIILISIITKNEKVFIYATCILSLSSLGVAAISIGKNSYCTYRKSVTSSKDNKLKKIDRLVNFITFALPSIIVLISYYNFIK